MSPWGGESLAILDSVTTEEALGKCTPKERELLGCEAAARAQEQIRRRVGEEIPAGVILFSSQYGILGQSSQAEILLEQYLQDRKKSGRKI